MTNEFKNYSKFISSLTEKVGLKSELNRMVEISSGDDITFYTNFISSTPPELCKIYCLQQLSFVNTVGTKLLTLPNALMNAIPLENRICNIYDIAYSLINKKNVKHFSDIRYHTNLDMDFDITHPVSSFIANSFIFAEKVNCINQLHRTKGYEIILQADGYTIDFEYLPAILWEAYKRNDSSNLKDYPLDIEVNGDIITSGKCHCPADTIIDVIQNCDISNPVINFITL